VLAFMLALLALAAGAASAAAPLSWTAPVSSAVTAPTSVSCPAFGLCVAVGSESASIDSTPGTGGSWSAVGTGSTHALASVSCPSTALCVAVGGAGDVVVSGNPTGGSWGALNPATGSDTENLASVSCPSTTFCLAVDKDGGAIYSTVAGLATWTSMTIDSGVALNGVSCPTSSFCAAVDANGNILTSSTPTSAASWHIVWRDYYTLVAISCAANGTCVAIDNGGHAIASPNASAAEPSWTVTAIDGVSSPTPTSVSCTPEAFCLVGDSQGYALESDNPAASQPTWSSAQPDAGGDLSGVSCTDAGLCAAVDQAGHALTATLPAPIVATAAAGAIAQTTATLNATVNPDDTVLTSCYFNYGTTTAYGSTAPCASLPSPTGGAQTVTAQISGLTASTAYYFQVVAGSAAGSATGAGASLTTLAPLRPGPSLSGTAALGDTLTCQIAVAVPAGLTVTYAWIRDATVIRGATSATYLVTSADETHHLYCMATISGDGGSVTGSSGYLAVPSETIGMLTETSVSKALVAAHSVSTTVVCSPEAVPRCTIKMLLTATERAADGRDKVVTVGSKTAEIADGATAKVTVGLNAEGRGLLAHKHQLRTALSVSGNVVGVISGKLLTNTVTFTTKTSNAARRSA
jgi:hypothetical protein